MQHEAPCPPEEFAWSIAAARLLLPADVHLQAPPNLSDDFGVLLDAGIDDWGGVSPVTADHVNPERPWPALDRLRDVTEARGFALAPRLTVYPRYVLEPERWLDPGVRFAVLDRSDAEGLGRDDPGSVWPEKISAADTVNDGAEIVLVGHRSSAWYSGADNPPPVLVPAPRRGGAVRCGRCSTAWSPARSPASTSSTLLRRSRPGGGRRRRGGRRAAAPDGGRRRHVGAQPQHQLHQRLHLQVPVLRLLQGAAVAEPPRDALPPDPRRHRRARPARPSERGATEVCLQGGIHPDFDGDYYLDVDAGREGGGARHPRPRLHGAGGDRGCQAARRAARRRTCDA